MGKLDWRNRACAAVLLCVATAIGLSAQTFKTLHRFDGTDGGNPFGALVQATGGNLYGTTDNGANGGGTVFKISPGGALTTLYSFCSQSGCTDGQYPSPLVQATGGNFYGTTVSGGANTTGCNGPSCGTVFKITPGGALTTLYSFCSQSGCPDGANPQAGLVQATNGDFYGTTSSGGANGGGTVFKITPSGTLTTLYSFCSQSGCPDGAHPWGLVQATNGSLYGTTLLGGANSQGTVFRITPSGTLKTLQNFKGPNGANPYAGLVQANDGNFYGTTGGGGANNDGTVFKITPSGALTTLYSFCSQTRRTDGANPYGALVEDTDGNFYGATEFGGRGSGYGTVFSLSVGLGPFVETQPASARVGGFVQILGTNLTGATSVSFSGTPAVFRVVLNSWIKTTVPEGATTGTVQVVTPGGTLSSNVPFRVRP